jgi:predicted permease
MAALRFAFRSLVKAPLLSLVVILSVGLGIGANTGVFSLLHQILLERLPVQRPEELVVVTAPEEFKGGSSRTRLSGGMDSIFSYPMFRGLETHPQGLSSIGAFFPIGANVAFGNQTVPTTVMLASGGYFPTLGVRPLVGRTIEPADDSGGGNPVAMLSYGYWTDHLGGETSVLNQPIKINGQTFTIIGVTPKGFTGTTLGDEPAAYVPLAIKPQLTPNWNGTDRWDDYYLYLIARVQPGVSRLKAQDALNGVYAGLVEEQSKQPRFHYTKKLDRFLAARLTLKDGSQGQSGMRDDSKVPLIILMCATGMVLLIAMANAANLLLARSAQRRREMAIRSAMGAGQGQLMRQMLLEALLLAMAGGAAGLLFAVASVQLLLAQVASDGPIHFLSADLNWPVLLFGLALSLATGLLFGLYPAWEGARASQASTLKEEAGSASGSKGAARVRKVLVCAQVMISAVLLIPTGLFLKSLVNLLHVDLGMRTENLVGFSVSPALNGYKKEQTHALFERMENEMGAIPGSRSVADAMVPLISGSNWGTDIQIEGVKITGNSNARYNEVGTGFFGKLGIPLIAGREFTDRDNEAGPKVAVVNQTFVKRFLDGRNAIGMRLLYNGPPAAEIVGVVKDSHYSGVKQTPPAMFYTPWRQDKQLNDLAFYVRSAIPEKQMIPQIRRVLASIDRDLPPEDLRTMKQQINENIRNDRIVLQLAAVFAVLATVLAMLGLYGVMAHSVTRRTREIGIRMALGAAPGKIRVMVMRELLWILIAGLVTGVPAALVLARYTKSQLFGVEAFDAGVVALALLALTVTAVAAGFLPARRASRVSPTNALRYE